MFRSAMARRRIDRENAVFRAEVEESAKLYDAMAETMKQLACSVTELNRDEMTLLWKAYRIKAMARRVSWRRLSLKLENESDEAKANLIIEYQNKVEAEMTVICTEILSIVHDLLLSPRFDDRPAFVFYYKMKGDFKRYSAELKTGDDKKVTGDESIFAYKLAMIVAEIELTPNDSLRLGVALNYSVCQYEIFGSIDKALEIANKALDDATSEFDFDVIFGGDEESNDAMRLLRHSVDLWEAEKLGQSA